MRSNLRSDDVRNCKKTTFVKERNPQLTYKQGLFKKNPKSPKSLEQVKLVKVFEKYPKLEVVINFKQFY